MLQVREPRIVVAGKIDNSQGGGSRRGTEVDSGRRRSRVRSAAASRRYQVKRIETGGQRQETRAALDCGAAPRGAHHWERRHGGSSSCAAGFGHYRAGSTVSTG